MEAIAKLLFFALSELRPAERLSAGASRITNAAVLSAAAVVVMTIAMGCVVAAAWIALIPVVGSALAALISAFALLVVAGILWLMARNQIKRENPPSSHDASQDPLRSGLQEGLSALFGGEGAGLDEVKRLFGEHKIPILLAAVVLGMALGGSNTDHRRN